MCHHIAAGAGCVSIRAQAEVQRLQERADPLANQAAGQHLQQARDDLSNAGDAVKHNNAEDLMYWSYLALHEAQIGEAQTTELRARSAVASASAERDHILLEAQRRRAELAQERAQRAEQDAQAAAQALQAAQQEQQSAQAQQQIAQAQDQAQQAEQRAQEAQRQAQQVAQQAQQQVDQATQQANEQVEQAKIQTQRVQQQLEQAQDQSHQAEQQLKELQATQTARGMVLTLSNSVLFASNSDTLESGGQRVLQSVADFHAAISERIKVRIEGFHRRSGLGRAATDDALSQRRAEAVAKALQSDGVEPLRLEALGRGKSLPVASNDTSAGRLQNRRVEIVFSNLEGQFRNEVAGR